MKDGENTWYNPAVFKDKFGKKNTSNLQLVEGVSILCKKNAFQQIWVQSILYVKLDLIIYFQHFVCQNIYC